MLFLALLLFLFPVAQAGSDGQIPPFDPSQATYDPSTGSWCDRNYCVYDPGGPMGWLYRTPACVSGYLCGWGKWEAEDPDVIQWMIDSIVRDPFCQTLACPVPIPLNASSCSPGHPLCSRVVGDGGGGGGDGGRRDQPPGSADACPAPEVIRFDPVFRIASWPPHPIVVGQDPRREGIRYEIEVRIPPVLYRRWEREPDRCVPVPDADGNGKPDREQGTCSVTIGDPPVPWPGDLVPGECRLVEERYPEPVSGQGLLSMVLRPSSRAWIQGELAARYPGARVRQPVIQLPVAGAGQVLGDKTFLLTAVVNPKPVDPGYYDVSLAFTTAGTPVSPPRTVVWRTPDDRPQPVYLLEVTLVR